MLSAFQQRNLWGIAGVVSTLAVPYFIGLADAHIESSQSLCPFKLLTGMPCAGCGITKSLIFFYQGNLAKSLYYHAFGPLVVVALLALFVLLTVQVIINRALLKQVLYHTKLAYTLGAVLAIYHGFRLVYFIQNTSLSEILQQSIWK